MPLKTKNQHRRNRLLEVISSNLRLLVLVRESLFAFGAKDSPLFAATRDQAQLCGTVLPNSMRMDPAELEKIRARASLPPAERESSKIITP